MACPLERKGEARNNIISVCRFFIQPGRSGFIKRKPPPRASGVFQYMADKLDDFANYRLKTG